MTVCRSARSPACRRRRDIVVADRRPWRGTTWRCRSERASNLFLPTGSNWTEQSAGSAMTVTGALACARASAGLAAVGQRSEQAGNRSAAASAQPAMMIGLRPILSDSQPNRMKKGVASASAMAIRMLAVAPSTLSVFSRKKSA